MNVQIASPPEAVGRVESTTSVGTVAVEPQKQHQSKWEMQSEVSGDGLRGLLNIAPDLTTIGKKRSLNNVGSSAGMAKSQSLILICQKQRRELKSYLHFLQRRKSKTSSMLTGEYHSQKENLKIGGILYTVSVITS